MDSPLMVYVFPIQFVVGVGGNLLNIMVLLSKPMRSKTNTILAGMAVADILFLLFMLPHSLMYNSWLMRNQSLKNFIIYSNYHIVGVVNVCSFVSAWSVVVVSIERAVAVACPLRTWKFWTRRRVAIFLISIWTIGAILSIPTHITHTVNWVTRRETIFSVVSGQLEVVERRGLQPSLRPGFEGLWRISKLVDIALVVVLPVVLVVTANAVIVLVLRQMDAFTKRVSTPRPKKATFIVYAIATTFTVCHSPSAILHVVELMSPEVAFYSAFRTAATLTNALVVTEKTANLFMFCIWSTQFRQNLRRLPSQFTISCTSTRLRTYDGL